MSDEFIVKVSDEFPIRPYRALELCKMYGVGKKVFLQWLKSYEEEIGERKGQYYTIHQVAIIIKKVGIPGKRIEDPE